MNTKCRMSRSLFITPPLSWGHTKETRPRSKRIERYMSQSPVFELSSQVSSSTLFCQIWSSTHFHCLSEIVFLLLVSSIEHSAMLPWSVGSLFHRNNLKDRKNPDRSGTRGGELE